LYFEDYSLKEHYMKRTNIFFLLIFFVKCFQYSPLVAQKPELTLPIGHTSVVSSAVFSQDLKLMVTSSRDGTAKIWDVKNGKLLHSLEGHRDWINTVAFSPDGKWILTASSDSTAKVWDAQSGKLFHSLNNTTAGVSFAFFSHDGKKIVTVLLNDDVIIWDAETFNLLHFLKGHSDKVPSETFHEIGEIPASISSDGKLIVTASRDGVPKIWDVYTGKLLHSLNGHSLWVYSAVFSADNKWVITTSKDGTAKIWNVQTGIMLESFDGGNSSASFSPDGRLAVIITGSQTAEIWDVQTGEFLHSLSEDLYTFQFINTATFSPDGKCVITTSTEGTAKIWDTQTGALLQTLKGHKSGCELASFSHDSKWIATGSMDGTVAISDIQTGALIHLLEGHTSETHLVNFSPDGKWLVTVSSDNTAKIWDIQTGKWLHTLKGHTDWITSATFSPGSNWIVTSSYDNSAKIWDVQTGKLLYSLKGHTDEINSAVFSPDGKWIVTASVDRTAKIWDSQNGTLISTLEGHSSNVSSAVFSPDGKWILTESYDGFAKIWNPHTGKILHTIKTNTGGIYSASFKADSRLIVTASFGNDINIWDVQTGDLLESFKDKSSAISNPENKWIADALFDKTTKIWDTISGGLIESFNKYKEIYAIDNQNKRFVTHINSKLTLNDLNTGKELISWVAIDSSDWAVIHPSGLFDASAGAMKKMYYVQNGEIIELNQLKDRYYEPGLWEKVMGSNTEPLRDVKDFEEIKLPPAINLGISDGVLNINLEDRGGGIGKYMVLINSKEVLTGNLPESETKFRGGTKLTSNFDLKNHPYLLPNKENEIEVKAYNGENFIISQGEKVFYNQGKYNSTDKPRLFIISLGISDYTGDLLDLKYAAKDAEDITLALKLGAKNLFGAEETFAFKKTTNDPDRLNWPTKENIRKTFEEVAKEAKASDVLVVYLSGHGMNLGGQDGDFFYLTQDAYSGSAEAYTDPVIRGKTTLSSAELTELIKSVSALKEVLIIDACASGRTVENLMAKRDISSSTLRALDRMKDRTGLHIITGCAADAVSYEASRFGQGVLTYSLLEGIKGASLREEKFIDVAKLFQYCTERVPQLAGSIGGIQQPQVFSPYGESSFDIGEILSADKQLIPLAIAKPMILMSSLKEKESFDDILGIEKMVDDNLRDVSSKAISSPFIFIEAKEYPEAYRIRGAYSITGDQVEVMVNIFFGIEKAGSFSIKGNKNDLFKLSEEILKKSQEVINKK
jgi:WD40 repeat protein